MSASHPESSERRTVSPRRADQVSGLIWLAVGAFVMGQAGGLEYIAEYGPGPGFFPFWLALGIVLLGLGLSAKAILVREEGEAITLPDRNAARQIAMVMGGYFGFALLAKPVGFFLTVGAMFVFLLMAVERRGWRFSLAVAAFCTLILWALFEVVFQLQFPLGVLELL